MTTIALCALCSSTRSSLECDYWVGKFPKDGLYTFVPFILADQNQAITKGANKLYKLTKL